MEILASPKNPLLVLFIILQVLGSCGGPLIVRLYFLHGGNKLWLSSLLQNGGLPIPVLIILICSYIHRRRTQGSKAKLLYIQPFLCKGCVLIGILGGLDNFFYANGASKLPVSTSSLITATQLAFVAGFAFLLVKQKFTKYSIAAIVLLTIGAAILSLHASNDLPEGESSFDYAVGLVMTLAASALLGLMLPLMELICLKSGQEVTLMLTLEVQVVSSSFAAVFSLLGMSIHNDFKDIPIEARGYDLGEVKYYIILVASAIIYQCSSLGSNGVVFKGSGLLSGIISSALLPVIEIFAVFFYQESFEIGKGVALVLSLLGSISYFYGEMKQKEEEYEITEEKSPLLPNDFQGRLDNTRDYP